jgi:5'-3' exonuclease
MIVHLVDGTYELYRQHFGSAARHSSASETAASVGVLSSTIALLESGATHIAVATDHVIESFRNNLWDGYKTSDGMEDEILSQITVIEKVLEKLGVTVWPMVKYEADDALASGARVAGENRSVRQVLMLTPDKDLGQCVKGKRIVQLDRRNDTIIDEDAVRTKFGVGPESIADWLGLVGDTADGFPGLSGWGAKSASTVLAKFKHIEEIPDDHSSWNVTVRGAEKLANTLREQRDLANLFKKIATTVDTVKVGEVDDWEWQGPLKGFEKAFDEIGASRLIDRVDQIASRRLR